MKTSTTLTATAILLAGLILLGTFSREPARGQTSSLGGGPDSRQELTKSPGGVIFIKNIIKNSQKAAYKLRSAVKKLRTAKDAAAKEKAKKHLSAVLKDQFDADLKQREKEITDIEARVKQLRRILEKRRTARDEIIQLQIKVLVNEADGLGFPTGTRNRGGNGFGDGVFPPGIGGGIGPAAVPGGLGRRKKIKRPVR